MPGEHKRSGVWKFFTKDSATESSCNICDQICKSSGNTTNLRNHLKSKHQDAFKALSSFSEDLDVVCATSRMEWGECHVDKKVIPFEENDSALAKELSEKSGKKRNRRRRKDLDLNPLKNIHIEDFAALRPKSEHDLDIFGRCIAAQLKKLPEKKAVQLTLEINRIVAEARLEDIEEQMANKVSSENPQVITVSYGDPVCSTQSDNENPLEIMHQ